MYNHEVIVISPVGRQEMEVLDDETGASTSREPPRRIIRGNSPARRVPCNDVTGRVRPISAEEQARNARLLPRS